LSIGQNAQILGWFNHQ